MALERAHRFIGNRTDAPGVAPSDGILASASPRVPRGAAPGERYPACTLNTCRPESLVRLKPTAFLLVLLVLGGLAFVGWRIFERFGELDEPERQASRVRAPAAVEAASITTGPIVARRTFSGSLEPTTAFVVSARVPGRVQELGGDIGDVVRQGTVVLKLDDAEYVLAVAQAEAEVLVAEAGLTEATSALAIADRALARMERLKGKGIESESRLDAVVADQLAKRAALAVAQARLARSRAALDAERVRLGYASVAASWEGDETPRVIGERFVDPGETIGVGEAVMTILQLDPITGVVSVPERDYARIAIDQRLSLVTDAYPGERFEGTIERIAPEFRRNTRQARVEFTVPNADGRLRPGMFVRASIEVAAEQEATIVPVAALTRRSDQDGVFVVAADGSTARWVPVAIGLREGERVQVSGEGLKGRVITLGQQLLDDGSTIVIPSDEIRATEVSR